MKKIIIIVFTVLNIGSLNASNMKVEELLETLFVETHTKKIPEYKQKVNNHYLTIKFQKGMTVSGSEDNVGRMQFSTQSIQGKILIDGVEKHSSFFNEASTIYDQTINIVSCIDYKNNLILSLMLSYTDSSRHYPQYIRFSPKMYKINNDTLNVVGQENNVLNLGYWENIIPDNPNNTNLYPYYSKQKILERLYETHTCDRKTTKTANIQIKVGDKWIPQSQYNSLSQEELLSEIKDQDYSLPKIEQTLKQKKDLNIYNKDFFRDLLPKKPIEKKTLTRYNNIAYYLQKAGANEEAVYLLEKILEKYPNRTVAHYNLADAYWALGEKKKAMTSYKTYIQQMKDKGKEKRIPKVVIDRASTQL